MEPKLTPAFALFTAAVAETAAWFGITHAIAHKKRRNCYYVTYTNFRGETVDTEASHIREVALLRFEQALTGDHSHAPNQIITDSTTQPTQVDNKVDSCKDSETVQPTPPVEMDGYIPALHPSIFKVLPLTHEEKESCNIFALGLDYRADEDESFKGRFAVALPIARKDWQWFEPGQILIYTERYQFLPEDGYGLGATSLNTRVGPLHVYDDKRGLFYAADWGSGTRYDLLADDVTEVWKVTRFIEADA